MGLPRIIWQLVDLTVYVMYPGFLLQIRCTYCKHTAVHHKVSNVCVAGKKRCLLQALTPVTITMWMLTVHPAHKTPTPLIIAQQTAQYHRAWRCAKYEHARLRSHRTSTSSSIPMTQVSVGTHQSDYIWIGLYLLSSISWRHRTYSKQGLCLRSPVKAMQI